MGPVISREKWEIWRRDNNIDITSAEFMLETCYYGKGWRSRPGSLFVYKNGIIHHSYSPEHAYWAVGEKSIRIDMPFQEIVSATKKRISFGLRLMQLGPESHFEIKMRSGVTHDLILHRLTAEFERVLEKYVSIVPF